MQVTERMRIRYAFWLALGGLLIAALLAVYLVCKVGMETLNAAGLMAIIGLFTSVTGTLVGAFFGIQIAAGSASEERVSRQKAETMTHIAMGLLSPEDAKKAIAMMGGNEAPASDPK